MAHIIMPVSSLEDKGSGTKYLNSPLMQHSLHLLNKHKCAALFKTFRHMKKRIVISPHQRFLHLPLGPFFSPTGQGWFRRIGARTILAAVSGSPVRLADNWTPEEAIFSCAFIFTKRMAIYINVNTKARIETKSILVYLITSLCNLVQQKHRTPSLQCVPYRYDFIYIRVSTDPLACCHFFHYCLFLVSNQRLM
jgi:hypothetical protein